MCCRWKMVIFCRPIINLPMVVSALSRAHVYYTLMGTTSCSSTSDLPNFRQDCLPTLSVCMPSKTIDWAVLCYRHLVNSLDVQQLARPCVIMKFSDDSGGKAGVAKESSAGVSHVSRESDNDLRACRLQREWRFSHLLDQAHHQQRAPGKLLSRT